MSFRTPRRVASEKLSTSRGPIDTPVSTLNGTVFAHRGPATILAGFIVLLLSGGAPDQISAAQNQDDPDEPSSPIYADSLTHLESWGSYTVSVANEQLYFGSGNRLIVADASSPGQPREISRLTLPYLVRDVQVAGAYVYVANDAGGFRVIDVSDPVEPTEVAALSFGDRVDAVHVEGNHAYLAARSDGVHVLNISDPENPDRVGHHETDEQAAGITVEGNYAHVAATFGGHRILDVSDPSQPEEIGFAVRGSYDQGYSWDVAVDGDEAYVANVEIGIRRVDISNPEDRAPTRGIQQTIRRTNDNTERHEVLDRPAAIEVVDEFGFVADQNAGLRILDLSEPDTLRIVGTVDTPDRALDVAVSGNTAFVADRYAGIRVIDVSDPFAPREIGFWDDDQHAVQVSRVDGELFLADRQNGLWSLDVASPTDPTPTWFHHLPELSAFAVNGSTAAAGNEGGVLRILDLSNRSTSGERGSIDLAGPIQAVVLSGSYAYVAAEDRGLRIVDLSDPDEPEEIAAYLPEHAPGDPSDDTEFRYYPNAPSAWAVTLDDETAYLSLDNGIQVLDVSDPSDPRPIGRYDHSERAMQTVLRDDLLYAAFDDGLRVLDVEDPTAPRLIGHVDTPSYARDVALGDSQVYVADLTGGLVVVDVTDPSAPRKLTTTPIERGRLVDVFYDGAGRVFAGATTAGLRVFDVADPDAPRLLSRN